MMNNRKRRSAVAAGVVLAMATTTAQAHVQSLRLVIRAFIPNEHPTNPGYIRPVPNSPGSWMVPGPNVPFVSNNPLPFVGSCYNTNDRGFSSELVASSKVESQISMTWNAVDGTYSVGQAGSSTGVTRRMDCTSALTECMKKPTNPVIETTYAVLGEAINIHVNAAASDPCTLVSDIADLIDSDRLEAFEKEMEGKSETQMVEEALSRFVPKLKWNGVFTVNAKEGTIRFVGTIQDFPAYEAYLYVDDQPVTILRESPTPNSTAWSLLTSRQIDATAKFTPLKAPPKVTLPSLPAAPPIIGSWKGQMVGVNHTLVFSAGGRVTATNWQESRQGTWSSQRANVTVTIGSRTWTGTVAPGVMVLKAQAPAGVITATLIRQ